MPKMRPCRRRFSRPVSATSTPCFCWTTPMPRRTRAASRRTSRFATRAVPESACDSVVRIFTAVVFPAPFGPSRPNTVPSGTENVSPSSARTPPGYVLTRSSASIASTFVLLPDGPRPVGGRSRAEPERRVTIGDEQERIGANAVGPAEHAEDEVEQTARIPAREEDREPREDDREDRGEPQKREHDEVRDRQKPFDER